MPPSQYDPQKHRRRSIRLKGYDYSQPGAYFITICTRGKQCLLGKIVNSDIELNEFGEIVEAAWFDLPAHYPHVELGAFCIMPNHVHGIIILKEDAPCSAEIHPRKRHPLSEIVRALKSFSARRINENRNTPGISVWQRDYYDRIIRNELEFEQEALYILSNPQNWHADEEYFEGK